MDNSQAGRTRVAAGFSVLLGCVAGGLWHSAPALIGGYRPEARFFDSSSFFPRTALLMIAVCAVIHLIGVLRGLPLSAGEDLDEFDVGRGRVLGAMLLFGCYAALVPFAGYAVSTLLFVIVATRFAGIGWPTAVTLSVLMTSSLYLVFVVGLKVWFPAAALASWP